MSNEFCINKSGQTIPVYDTPEKNNRIGSIYNREAFGWDRDWGGDLIFNHIIFRNSAGNVVWGFIVANTPDFPAGVNTDCTDYPYGTATINGINYVTFKFRRSETIYKGDGTTWGSVASGMRVACLSSLSGQSHPNWKSINYVERSSDHQWIPVTGGGYNYGFVNTGLEDGSTPSTISMYGTW